ncbi:MAG: beta-ketoacyl-[acyl-carrier-protein] synthase family protein [Candidatus Omnitrophica bacterium]|nr:beta-ketoacyl-[acyl-carrier-protein] synthase family protein [Candidatus Omnitrophota bacterium]
MDRRIVITGLGVLASTGIGKNDFWAGLKEGRSGMKPITLFDMSTCRTKLGGEISDFKPEEILGVKGLRNLDRTTKLALCAAGLALDDAGIKYPLTEAETDEFGVSLGSTMGSVWSISEFDKEALRNGPRSVNPALFSNTVMNSPASHMNIRFNIQGFSSTVSTGFCSSIDAIYYAINQLELYDYKVVLAGGVEEMCEQTYKGFHKIGHLAGSRAGKEEVNCPYDKRRNGIMFGEGASIVILEELEHAKKRNARIYAEILGYGTSFDPKSRNIYSPKAEGATEAIKNCLDDAKIDTGDIDYISASGNSTLDCDCMETRAVKNVFGKRANKVPMSSVKSMIGESFSASGALGIASSLGVFEKEFIPPTINYHNPDKRCDLDYVPNKSQQNRVKNILINSFSPSGSNSTLMIGRYE